jgi:rhamnosyltransferase
MMSSFDELSEPGSGPSVGVMLATYNGAAFVAEQIETILGQRGVATTIYVRDDGSSDNTLEIVRVCSETHPGRIILLGDAPCRFGTACGNFLSMLVDIHGAPHDYFAFSDQDDIWLPEKLGRAVGRLTASGASGYASNLTAFSDALGTEWTIAKAGPQQRFDHLFQSASAGCTYVFDTKAAELIATRIGRAEEHDWSGMSHDWLCYAICRSHGLSWTIDVWSGIRYRQHQQNLFGAMPGASGALKRLSLMRDGWYRGVLLRNRPFLDPANAEEQSVLDRMARLGFGDRLWLAARARKFRREPKAQLALAGALLLGLV